MGQGSCLTAGLSTGCGGPAHGGRRVAFLGLLAVGAAGMACGEQGADENRGGHSGGSVVSAQVPCASLC